MTPETLTWRLLTAEELTSVYLNEMRRDFPAGELKPLSMILNSEAAGTAHTWGVYDDGMLVAYLLMVRPVGCEASQLDYFAVLPAYRNSGLGESLLAALPNHENAAQAILIEAECPEKAEDEAVWAFMPGAGPGIPAGPSISLMPGSGCWCCPAWAGRCAAPRKPCVSWRTAIAAPWASPSGVSMSPSIAPMA